MDNNFQSAINRIAEQVADMVVCKQKDYGKNNILNSPFGAEKGIIIRLYDKISRISNLIDSNNPNFESIDDNWRDIIGYALIAIMVREGSFDLPLNKEPHERKA